MRAVYEQIENDGEHSPGPGRPDERQAAFATLLDEWVAMTSLLDLSGSDPMALNVTDIPWIPDQAANLDHMGAA